MPEPSGQSPAPVRSTEVCIIVPCYNEEAGVGAVVRACQPYVNKILVVDDCSTDGTAAEARNAGAEVISHKVNSGKGMALKTGFQRAAELGYQAALTVDGDGQHDPSEIPLFLDEWKSGNADVVIGNRMTDTRAMPWTRRFANRFSSAMISRSAGVKLHDSQCGYRLISLKIWNTIQLTGRRFDLESEILIKACRAGARVSQVTIKTIYFDDRQSKINPITDTLRLFQMLWRTR